MSQWVLEVGSEALDPVMAVGERWLGPLSHCAIETLAKVEEEEFLFRRSDESIGTVLRDLNRGHFTSIWLRNEAEDSKRFMIFRPCFGESRFPLWIGTVDFEGTDAASILNPLKEIQGLCFAVVSLQEGLDLELLEDLSVASFPWDHWRLVRAAVRRPDGTWEERKGPAAEQLKGHRSRPGEASRP